MHHGKDHDKGEYINGIFIAHTLKHSDVLLKRIGLMSSTDISDSNDLAIMDARPVGHHGKEDGGG